MSINYRYIRTQIERTKKLYPYMHEEGYMHVCNIQKKEVNADSAKVKQKTKKWLKESWDIEVQIEQICIFIGGEAYYSSGDVIDNVQIALDPLFITTPEIVSAKELIGIFSSRLDVLDLG